MKKTKVIIPALGLLLLSTAASVTGTVAWFAANSSVQASGMYIQAKSDSSFLIIGTSATLSDVQTANSTTADLSSVHAEVYPVAHDAIANTAAANATDVSNLKQYKLTSNESTKISIDAYNALPAGPVDGDANDRSDYTAENAAGTNWYTQVADAVTASTSTKQKTYLATLDANYIIHTTLYVTMSVGSNDGANLKVKDINFAMRNDKTGDAETMNPVRALVTSASASVEFTARSGGPVVPNSTVLADSVTSTALVPIDIYVYYDGNDADVFTNNTANLEGATISITFDVGR